MLTNRPFRILTLKRLREELNRMGISVSMTSCGSFRIAEQPSLYNTPSFISASSHYCDDLEEASKVGRDMARTVRAARNEAMWG